MCSRSSPLGNGRILVVGGAGESTTELYDPSTGACLPGGTLNHPRWLHGAVRLADGRVLVAGGGSSTPTAEVCEPATGRWTSIASLRTARRSHTATLLSDGRVLVAGGFGADGWLREAELYDPARGRWQRTASMTWPRESATATLLGNGRVLAAGGGSPSAPNSAELYDPASGRWNPTGSMTGYGGAAALLHDGRLLVAGQATKVRSTRQLPAAGPPPGGGRSGRLGPRGGRAP